MLLLRRFTNPTPQMHDLPIALRAANGDTICVFPADVISNIRQSIGQLYNIRRCNAITRINGLS